MVVKSQRTALITGASRGLGLALSTALAHAGWDLIINGRDTIALELARVALSDLCGVTAIAGNVAEEATLAALADAASRSGLRLLVNNASTLGMSPLPRVLDTSPSILENIYRVNVIAPIALLENCRDSLQTGSKIVNITSDAAVEAYPEWGGYGSSKAALEHISAVLAVEEPDWRVYCVDPGDMRTRMHQDAFPGEDISDRPLPETSVPGILALIDGDFPSGRYIARDLETGGKE